MSLTIRSLLIASVLTLVGIAGQWSAIPGSTLPWRIGAAVLLFALIYEAWRVRQLSLHVSATARPVAYLNRSEQIHLIFRKRQTDCVSLQYRFSPQKSILLPGDLRTVAMSEEHEHIVPLQYTPVSLGTCDLPPINVRVLGPWGLAWWPKKFELEVRIEIGPDFPGRARIYEGMSATGESAGRSIGSGHELLYLRNYRPGDPPRAIDWKATARSGRLMTREWTEDQQLQIMIAVDASRTSGIRVDGLSRLGHFANAAARLSEYAIHNDDKVGMLVFASEPLTMLLPGRGLAAVARIRQMLTGVETQPVESGPLRAMMQLRQHLRHRCLIILMSDLDEQVASGQLSESVQLVTPKHSTLIVGVENTAVAALGSAEARVWRDPYISLAASEYLLNRRSGIRQLRRRGCQVISAPPGQLARKALNTYQALRQRHRV